MSPLTPQREEYIKKKKARKLFKYEIAIFILVFIIAGVTFIAHRASIRISRVELSGGVLVTEKDVTEKTLQYLTGSYLFLFPKNNALLYPHDDLKKYLADTFKRIDTIDIRLQGLDRLVISITERKPQALWCETAEKCFFLDANSTIFAEAPDFSGDAYFKYYGLVSTSSPIGLEYMASSTEFREVSNFIETVKQLSLRPLYLLAKENDEFSLVISGGGEIYFDMKEPLSKVGENLTVLLRTPALKIISGKDLPVEYIDLRFGNKLYYKLK